MFTLECPSVISGRPFPVPVIWYGIIYLLSPYFSLMRNFAPVLLDLRMNFSSTINSFFLFNRMVLSARFKYGLYYSKTKPIFLRESVPSSDKYASTLGVVAIRIDIIKRLTNIAVLTFIDRFYILKNFQTCILIWKLYYYNTI